MVSKGMESIIAICCLESIGFLFGVLLIWPQQDLPFNSLSLKASRWGGGGGQRDLKAQQTESAASNEMGLNG